MTLIGQILRGSGVVQANGTIQNAFQCDVERLGVGHYEITLAPDGVPEAQCLCRFDSVTSGARDIQVTHVSDTVKRVKFFKILGTPGQTFPNALPTDQAGSLVFPAPEDGVITEISGILTNTLVGNAEISVKVGAVTPTGGSLTFAAPGSASVAVTSAVTANNEVNEGDIITLQTDTFNALNTAIIGVSLKYGGDLSDFFLRDTAFSFTFEQFGFGLT